MHIILLFLYRHLFSLPLDSLVPDLNSITPTPKPFLPPPPSLLHRLLNSTPLIFIIVLPIVPTRLSYPILLILVLSASTPSPSSVNPFSLPLYFTSTSHKPSHSPNSPLYSSFHSILLSFPLDPFAADPNPITQLSKPFPSSSSSHQRPLTHPPELPILSLILFFFSSRSFCPILLLILFLLY